MKSEMHQKGRYYALAAIGLAFTFVGAFYHTLLFASGHRGWHFLAIYSILIFGVVLSSIVTLWLKSDKLGIAGLSLISYTIISGLVVSTLFTSVGLMMQAVITFAGIVFASVLLSNKIRIYAIIATIVSGMIAFGTDLAPTLWRLPTQSPVINLLLVVAIIAAFGLYLVKFFETYTLRTRLLLVVLGINLLTVVLLAPASLYLNDRLSMKGVKQRLSVAAEGLVIEIDNFFAYTLEDVQVKANNPLFLNYLLLPTEQRFGHQYKTSAQVLLNTWKDQKYVDSYSLLDNNQRIVLDTAPKYIGENNPVIISLDGSATNSGTCTSYVYYLRDAWLITCAAPIFDSSDLVGYLVVNINANAVQSIVEANKGRSNLDSYGVVLDDKGILLAHAKNPDLNQYVIAGIPELEIQKLQKENRLTTNVNYLYVPGLRELMGAGGESLFQTQMVSSESKPEIGYTMLVNLSQMPWKLVYFQPKASSFLLNSMHYGIIVITEILLIAITILGIIASRHFTMPIHQLLRGAQDFSEGNLNSKVEVSNHDEYGVLAKAFNQMVAELRNQFIRQEMRDQERSRGLEASVEIGRRISVIADPSELVNEAARQVQKAFKLSAVCLYLVEGKPELLRFKGGIDQAGEPVLDQVDFVHFGVGVIGQSALQKSVVLVSHKNTHPDPSPDNKLINIRLEIAVPIMVSEELLGILYVQQNQDQSSTNEDVDLLQLIASQIALALRNVQVMKAVEIQSLDHYKLSLATENIIQNSEEERALKVAVREIGRVTSAPFSWIKVRRG
jgi:HAMP domain-containing protein/putative methionine-R-sulfoxide reductase with GAF domain